jgi:hypothetical protein
VGSSAGGVEGNARLTGTIAAVLLVLLAAEGVTVRVGALLSVHVFIGMLLVPPIVLKIGSTGYRFIRYYAGSPAYRRKGPPAALLRSSFFLWFAAMTVHVLGHIRDTARLAPADFCWRTPSRWREPDRANGPLPPAW